MKLSHEEVVNCLDDDTVSYDVGLGVSNNFADTFRVSIKVEKAEYETAIAWLRDLIYGSEFDKERCGFSLDTLLSKLSGRIWQKGSRSFSLNFCNLCQNSKEMGLMFYHPSGRT